jgi:hypothetical protein
MGEEKSAEMGMIRDGRVHVNLTSSPSGIRFFIRASKSLDSSTDIVFMECHKMCVLATDRLYVGQACQSSVSVKRVD